MQDWHYDKWTDLINSQYNQINPSQSQGYTEKILFSFNVALVLMKVNLVSQNIGHGPSSHSVIF